VSSFTSFGRRRRDSRNAHTGSKSGHLYGGGIGGKRKKRGQCAPGRGGGGPLLYSSGRVGDLRERRGKPQGVNENLGAVS